MVIRIFKPGSENIYVIYYLMTYDIMTTVNFIRLKIIKYL